MRETSRGCELPKYESFEETINFVPSFLIPRPSEWHKEKISFPVPDNEELGADFVPGRIRLGLLRQ